MGELVPAEIESYAVEHSMEESELCRELRAETHRHMESPQMLVGPLEGALLKMLTQLVRATQSVPNRHVHGVQRSVLRSLAHHGTVTTCEIDKASAALARRYFARSPHGAKISIRMGPTLRRCGHLIDSMMSSSSMQTNRTT